MKKIFLSFLILTMGAADAISQQKDSIIQLDEITVEAPSNKTIIKKAIGNLHNLSKETYYGGNCQFIQIMESAGSVIQLTREYGYLFSNGYSDKKRNEWDSHWTTSFNPVYNARSLRYDITGNDVLTTGFYSPDDPHASLATFYDARVKYVFEITRLIYLYGPVYSRNWTDYTFTLKNVTSHSYILSFESSDNYPLKNSLYAKGQLEIDSESMKLKSITIENMGMHYAAAYVKPELQLKRYPDFHDKRILQDCVDCRFDVDTDGSINYALIHVLWSPDNEQLYKSGRGSQPRAIEPGTDFMVTECCKISPFKTNLDTLKGKPQLNRKDKKMIERFAKTLTYNATRFPEGSTYDPDAIDRIDWALDVSDAERQLDRKMPIQEQYRIQSSDYYSWVQERNAQEEDSKAQETYELRKQLDEIIRNNLFIDPLAQQ